CGAPICGAGAVVPDEPQPPRTDLVQSRDAAGPDAHALRGRRSPATGPGAGLLEVAIEPRALELDGSREVVEPGGSRVVGLDRGDLRLLGGDALIPRRRAVERLQQRPDVRRSARERVSEPAGARLHALEGLDLGDELRARQRRRIELLELLGGVE